MTVWSSTWVTGISKGHQIEANTRSVLERAAGRRFDRASWSRVAITDDQVRECGLAPVWKVDNRHRPARDHEAWEAEALGQPGTIQQLVRDALDALLPEPLDDVLEREAEQRVRVAELLDGPH
jgi:hypothetical protein